MSSDTCASNSDYPEEPRAFGLTSVTSFLIIGCDDWIGRS